MIEERNTRNVPMIKKVIMKRKTTKFRAPLVGNPIETTGSVQ